MNSIANSGGIFSTKQVKRSVVDVNHNYKSNNFFEPSPDDQNGSMNSRGLKQKKSVFSNSKISIRN
jgi:hypothetical protein